MSQPSPPAQDAANGAGCARPLTIASPSRTATVSPPVATTRLMKVCVELFLVGLAHG